MAPEVNVNNVSIMNMSVFLKTVPCSVVDWVGLEAFRSNLLLSTLGWGIW